MSVPRVWSAYLLDMDLPRWGNTIAGKERALLVERRAYENREDAGSFAFVLAMVVAMRLMGRLWWCKCGSWSLWTSDVVSSHNSAVARAFSAGRAGATQPAAGDRQAGAVRDGRGRGPSGGAVDPRPRRARARAAVAARTAHHIGVDPVRLAWAARSPRTTGAAYAIIMGYPRTAGLTAT